MAWHPFTKELTLSKFFIELSKFGNTIVNFLFVS